MSRRRRIEITVEQRRLVLRRSVWPPVCCVECSTPVQMLMPEEAAALTGVGTRQLYRWVEAGQIHFVETAEGRLLLCPNSLSNELAEKEKDHVQLQTTFDD